MKKIITLILVAIIAGLFISSCDKETSNSIEGTWKCNSYKTVVCSGGTVLAEGNKIGEGRIEIKGNTISFVGLSIDGLVGWQQRTNNNSIVWDKNGTYKFTYNEPYIFIDEVKAFEITSLIDNEMIWRCFYENTSDIKGSYCDYDFVRL